MAENGTVAYVLEKPPCDLCTHAGTSEQRASPAPADFDIKTRTGPWAFACTPHKEEYAMYQELGTGKGQKLEVRADD